MTGVLQLVYVVIVVVAVATCHVVLKFLVHFPLFCGVRTEEDAALVSLAEAATVDIEVV
jgi:hypothetical protein